MKFEDVLYEVSDGTAVITINRPAVLNAFSDQTVDELTAAFMEAWSDKSVGAIILTGAGPRAFSVGGDLSKRDRQGYSKAARCDLGTNIVDLHSVIRDVPKPVIAAVNGYAIGGGHVLHLLCDLTIAADTAKFGQVGPKVGSVDAGFGTAYLATIVGEKKAREIWYLCRQYTAEEAREMGLVNKVVPADKLMDEARSWAVEINLKSPMALKLAKQSFNITSEMLRGVSAFAHTAVALYYASDEAMEGRDAFMEKRPPNFAKFRR